MKNLKKLREAKGLNQQGLAMAIYVSQSTISFYETQSRLPDVVTLIRLADFFHCSTDYLLDRSNIRLPADDLVINRLSSEEAELIAGFRGLSSADKNKILGFLSALSIEDSDIRSGPDRGPLMQQAA